MTRNENKVEMKGIPGMEGIYSITEDGRVWSHERMVDSYGGRKYRIKGRWLKPSTSNKYVQYTLKIDNKHIYRRAHQLVAATYLPEPEEGHCVVRHIDDNPRNNHYTNLAWGSALDNSNDKFKNMGSCFKDPEANKEHMRRICAAGREANKKAWAIKMAARELQQD